MTSTKGPRKRIDYSKGSTADMAIDVDEDDLSSFDQPKQHKPLALEYYPTRSAAMTEEEELAQALRQIEEMEN